MIFTNWTGFGISFQVNFCQSKLLIYHDYFIFLESIATRISAISSIIVDILMITKKGEAYVRISSTIDSRSHG